MKNPLTVRVESSLGALFISLLSLFFIGFLFISFKNFDSDIDIMNGTFDNAHARTISQTELVLIRSWAEDNKIEVPEGNNYKYLLKKYPGKPWLN